jgi:integration host factor beta subunit
MTKRDLIDEVNKRFPHLSRRDSEVIINAIFDSMVEALAQGDRIEIRGFGSFVVKHRRARQGRNPKSGVLVSVAAKRVPFFKVGKELESMENRSREKKRKLLHEAAVGSLEDGLYRPGLHRHRLHIL